MNKPLPALVMTYLVVSLTYASALSLGAGAVLQTSVTGEDAVPGFRRANDTTTVAVYADSAAVSLLTASGAIPLECVNASAGYRCTYAFPFEYQPPGAYALSLEQASGDPRFADATYRVDGAAPRFGAVSVTQGAGRITASYSVTDTSSPTTPDCSGLVRVELRVNGVTIASEALDGGCRHGGTLSGAAPGISGEAAVTLTAEDALGNVGESAPVTRSFDTVPPSLPSSYGLFRDGVPVERYSTEARVGVEARFTVVEDRLASVVVDASALNPAADAVRPACTRDGALHTCTFPVVLAPSRESIPITITATDAQGNGATGDAYATLVIENTRPLATAIDNGAPCDECFLHRGRNDVRVLLDAPGGLRRADLVVTAEARSWRAEACEPVGSSWACVVPVTITGGTGQERVLRVTSAYDDVGNTLVQPYEQAFTVDDAAPRIISLEPDAACPTAGQELHLDALVAEQHSPAVTMSANVSQVTVADTVRAACSLVDEGEYRCRLAISDFLSLHTRGEVAVTFTDAAGNQASRTLQLEVCEAELDATPNYIRSLAPVGRLPRVDKRLASISEAVPYRVQIPLKADVAPPGRVVQATGVRCTGAFTTRRGEQTYLVNELGPNPVLVTHLFYDGYWPANDTVPVNCTLEFSMRRGNTLFHKPEVEALNVALPAVRQELGNPVQRLRDKQQEVADRIIRLQDKIDGKASLDKTLGGVCKLVEQIGTVNTGLQTAKAAIFGVAVAFSWAGGEALWATGNSVLSRIHQFIIQYLWPIGWVPTGVGPSLVGYGVKYSCALYTCKFYDSQTWVEMGLESLGRIDLDGRGDSTSGVVFPENAQEGDTVTESVRLSDGSYVDTEYTYRKDGGWTFSVLDPESAPGTFASVNGQQWFKSENGWSAVEAGFFATPGGPRLMVGSSFSPVPSTNVEQAFDLSRVVVEGAASAAVDVNDRYNPLQDSLESDLTADLVDSMPADDWVINPYRSVEYDALCVPAQLYNLRKEKQLQCLRLKCLEESANAGVPVTQCEERFAAQSCLYLESAQARTHGSISSILQDAFVAIGAQVALGFAVQCLYRGACKPYYSFAEIDLCVWAPVSSCSSAPNIVEQWSSFACGMNSLLCGLSGAAFALTELQDMYDGWRESNPLRPETEYCEGLEHWNVTVDDSEDSGDGGLL